MTRTHVLALSGIALLIAAAAAQLLPSFAGTARAATQHVAVQNNLYSPPALTINVGDTVQWDWPAAPNAIPHSVTSDSPSTELDSGAPQATGTYAHTFNIAGTYDYHCEVHGTAMSGTVTVQQVAAPTATNTAPAPTNTVAAATNTPARTNTPSATATGTVAPSATAIITPTHTSGLAPTAAPAQPTQTGSGAAAAAGAGLPRAGTGAPAGAVSFGWLSMVLGLAGAAAIAAAGLRRSRG